MHLNVSSVKWRPYSLGLNVLLTKITLSISYQVASHKNASTNHPVVEYMCFMFVWDVLGRWRIDLCPLDLFLNTSPWSLHTNPYPEPVVFQWQLSCNPVCLELRPQCTLECHRRNASVLPVLFQWCSSGFPVVFQSVPIMQINTGSPLGHLGVLASASVVLVASQCTCGSSGLPVCSHYAN